MSEQVVVGPCACGGYGITLDEEHAERMGACHFEDEAVAVLSMTTSEVRIRVERSDRGPWRAVVFDAEDGELNGGRFTGPTQSEVTERALMFATQSAARTLSVIWEGSDE